MVRLPEGTAHSLDSRDFPIPVMGKTGTTSDFRHALFVGSTYGRQGITVAVRIGFDDNRSLGEMETGSRTALPIFRDVMLQVYGRQLVGPVPQFPREIEDRIDEYLARRAASRITPLAPLPELTPTQSGAARQRVAASSSRTACGQAIQSASLLRCDQESSRVATGGRTPVEAVILAGERTPQRLDMGSTASSSTSIATESR